MQNLHEMSKAIFWGKNKKKKNISICCLLIFFTQSAKRYKHFGNYSDN